MSETSSFPDFTPEEAARISERVRERGMTFEVFLPEGLADWLKELIAKGVFASPKEAAFVAFQSLRDLHAHPDVQQHLLKAMVQASLNDPRPPVPAEEAFERLRQRLLSDVRPDDV